MAGPFSPRFNIAFQGGGQTATSQGNQLIWSGPAHLMSVTINTPPTYNKFSVHDAGDIGRASPLNCVYPQNFGSSDGITMKYGIALLTIDGTGAFTVNYTPG